MPKVEKIDKLGVFWLADAPDNKLSGRLTFDPTTTIKLSLVGDFEGDRGSNPRDHVRVHGWLENSKVTLVSCFSGHASWPSPGVATTSFIANGLFTGDHLDEEQATFDTLHLELIDLDNWVGSTGLEDSFDWDRSGTRPLYTLSFTPIDRPAGEFSRGTIRMASMWKRSSLGVRGSGLETWPAIHIEYSAPQAFDAIQQDAGRLLDLLILCIDGSSYIDRLMVTSKQIRVETLGGKDAGPQQIDYIAPRLAYVDPSERKPREQYRMLLTFEEVGGATTLAKWLDVVEPFQPALDSMMSITHARQMFGENRFLNVTYAAEAFHRETFGDGYLAEDSYQALLRDIMDATPSEHHEWLKDRLVHGNEPTLRKRLSQLATRAGLAVRPLIGDKAKWAFAVSQVRNTLTHVGKARNFEGVDLRYLSESVYAVTRACMLLAAGVPAEVLAAKAESAELTWYRGGLHRAITKVRTNPS